MSAARAVAERRVASSFDRRALAVLACGHGSVDVAQGSVPAMLPFLRHTHHYSYAAVAALVLAMTITSSLIQPVFGYLADRRSLPWLMPGGVLIAGLGISVAGLTTSYPVTFLVIAFAGIGVGAYHPEGARYANYASGTKRASGMSLYSVGGNAGFALGPILLTPLIVAFGLHGTLWLGVLYAIVFIGLVANLGYVVSFRPVPGDESGKRAAAATKPDRWRPFSLVAGIAAFRSAVYFGLQSFLAVYLIHRFNVRTSTGNAALSVMLAMGAVGTLVGGRLGDRVGLRPILRVCTALIAPLVLLLLISGLQLTFVVVALIGFFTVGTFSTTVVLGQRFLPNQIGVASGITLGAAIGVGGVCATLLGLLADATSVTVVIAVIAVLALPAFVCALVVPAE